MPLFKTLKIRHFKNGMAQYIEHSGGDFWKSDFFQFLEDHHIVPGNVMMKLKIKYFDAEYYRGKTFLRL